MPTKLCFVISPGKTDILRYYGGEIGGASIAYVVQPRPAGLCDAIFRALPLIDPAESVVIGLPDTIWFPKDGLAALDTGTLSFLLFPVEHPELFDAVATDAGRAGAGDLGQAARRALALGLGCDADAGPVLHELHGLWQARERQDEYLGTLVNAWLAAGGEAPAACAPAPPMSMSARSTATGRRSSSCRAAPASRRRVWSRVPDDADGR